jgi:raffinose/stachyose/melibiose transport system permease protein
MKERDYKGFLIIPALLFVFTFYLLPNILNFIYAFTDWSVFKTEINFVGIQNFIELSQRGEIWKDLLITLEYGLLVMILINLTNLVLALALERTCLFSRIMRTVFFIPVLIAPIAAGYIFKGFFGSSGIVADIFNINLLGSMRYALFATIIVHIWKFMGVGLLVYIAGLNSVPEELIEYARIEGANEFQIIKNIKIPLIGPSLTFNIALSMIGGLKVFATVLAMTQGGPARSTEVLNIFILQNFATGRLGYTTAISLILFLVIFIIAIPVIIFLRKREVEL